MNKKLSFITIMLISMALLVGAELIFEGENVSGEHGVSVDGIFLLENNNTYNITNLTFTPQYVNGMGDVIEVTTITPVTINLEQGKSTPIEFRVSIPQYQPEDTYSGTIDVDYINEGTGLPEPTEYYHFSIVVLETKSLSLDPTGETITLGQEESGDVTLTITNDGNVDLTGITLNHDPKDFEDDGGNEIDLFYSSTPFDLEPGNSETITITVITSDDQYLGSLSGVITFTSTEGISVDYTLTIETYTNILDISLDTPSNIDELEPGESFDFDVQLEALEFDMEDVSIKVWIKDIDDGDDLEDESSEFDLDDGEDKNVNFEFDTPYNVDEESFDIKVRVKGEDKDDSSNDFEFVQIFRGEVEVVKDEDEAVVFDNIDFSLSGALTCGSIFTVYADVINIGEDDLDDMYVKLEIEELGLEYTSVTFDLEEGNYDDREQSIDFLVTLPNDLTEDSYTIKFYAYNEDDDLFDIKYHNFDVLSCTTYVDDEGGLEFDEDDDNVIYLPTGFSVGDFLGGENAKMVFWVLVDLALLAVIIASIVWIAKRKKVNKKRKR